MAAPINPKGAKSDKIWRDAVMRAVRRLGGDTPPKSTTKAQRLDLLADALVAKGLEGDVPAIREVGDRLDGKAVQAIEQTSDVTHHYVARVPAIASNVDEWQKQHEPQPKTLQ